MIVHNQVLLGLHNSLADVAHLNPVVVLHAGRKVRAEFILTQDVVRDDSVLVSFHRPPIVHNSFALIVDASQLAWLVCVVLILQLGQSRWSLVSMQAAVRYTSTQGRQGIVLVLQLLPDCQFVLIVELRKTRALDRLQLVFTAPYDVDSLVV